MADAITKAGSGLNVPDNPVIPFIEGDGIGPDIWAAAQNVFDAAVEKAYGGTRQVAWQEVLAGEKAFNETGEWLPEATTEAFDQPSGERRAERERDRAREDHQRDGGGAEIEHIGEQQRGDDEPRHVGAVEEDLADDRQEDVAFAERVEFDEWMLDALLVPEERQHEDG